MLLSHGKNQESRHLRISNSTFCFQTKFYQNTPEFLQDEQDLTTIRKKGLYEVTFDDQYL